MYSKKTLNGYYFKSKGFYAFFIPIAVPYNKIYALAESAGLKKEESFGPILEKGKMFGFGWIGVEVEKPLQNRDDVININGEFDVYEHKGPYKTLGQAYKKIMKERPGAKEYFNLYLDDPVKVKPENCRTHIYFRY